jgi:predicted SAM-dependent methyltransferase
LRKAASNLIVECRIALVHARGTLKARSLRKRTALRLNVGCGPKAKEGWVNIDLAGRADLTLDARRRMPLPDGCCLIVYSEHFLEHLDYPTEVGSFLRNAYRVLQPGGVFSAGVPDTEWPLKAYWEGISSEYFKHAKQIWHPKWCVTRMEHINYHFRQGCEHRFAYDFETLKYVLEKAGFVQVRRRDFDPKLDSKDRELGTLYVEGFKPT